MKRLPLPRVEGLVVRELAGELVVYDSARHRAYCLNPTVASIWRSCEGGTSPGQARLRLEAELGRSMPDDVVWLGLDQLRKAGLLDESSSDAPRHPSRREVLRRVGAAGAALLPVVASLAVPPAVAAISCACNAKTGTNACNNAHCAIGARCGKTCTKFCQPNGSCA
jgi:hypothetical protein